MTASAFEDRARGFKSVNKENTNAKTLCARQFSSFSPWRQALDSTKRDSKIKWLEDAVTRPKTIDFDPSPFLYDVFTMKY